MVSAQRNPTTRQGVHASTGSVGCRGLSRSARFGGALPPKQHAAPTPLQLAVMEAAASPLCPGAVRAAVTMPTNAHHFEIAMLQREVMLRLGLTCTLARLVTVCLDSPCLSLCERKRVPRCIPLGTELKGGDFGDESWLRIAAAKWALMQEAVSTGVNALLLDDDVLVLGDVFAVVGRTEYDVQYSPKFLGPPDNCAGDANAGVVFVRATTAGRGFLDAMVSFKPRIEGAAKMSLDQSHLLLDQELFPEAITTAQAKRCILPPAQFAGHCRHARNATLRLGDLMTFHATCTETAARKLAVLQGVADAIGEPGYADRTLVSVDPDGADGGAVVAFLLLPWNRTRCSEVMRKAHSHARALRGCWRVIVVSARALCRTVPCHPLSFRWGPRVPFLLDLPQSRQSQRGCLTSERRGRPSSWPGRRRG